MENFINYKMWESRAWALGYAIMIVSNGKVAQDTNHGIYKTGVNRGFWSWSKQTGWIEEPDVPTAADVYGRTK